jgi:hypothetical protein
MNFNRTKFLSVFFSILLFAIITLVFFSPLLNGKAIKQGDVANFKGMSKEIMDYREKYGKDPLWTNSMFSGMPAYQIAVLYPSNLVKPLTKVLGFGIPHPAVIMFIAFIGFFFLLLTFNVELWLATIMALAFGLSSYTIILIEAGHNPKGYAIAYMAPVLAGLFMTFRGKLILGSALFALALSLELSVNHVQITYYLMIAAFILSLGEVVRLVLEKNISYLIKASVMLLVSALLAVGPNLTNLMLTEEYGNYSTRGKSELTDDAGNKTSGLDKDYATQWSYGISESFSLMIPNFKGGPSGAIGEDNKSAIKNADDDYKQYIEQMDQYFGDQPFTSGPVYFGAIICFLFVLSLLILEDKIKWYVLAAILLSLMLSWGKNFMGLTDFFLENVPGYNKFRAVSMILVIAQVLVPFLAALGINELIKNPDVFTKYKKNFFIAFALTGGLCLLFYIAPSMFNTFFKEGEYEQLSEQLNKGGFQEEQKAVFMSSLESVREAIFKADVFRSLLFILSAAVLIFLYTKKIFNKSILIASLGFLIFIDSWTVDKRYLNEKKFVPQADMDVPFSPSNADLQILQDKDPNYRVLNTTVSTFNDASTSYFHKSIGGYHGAKLKRYQELIEKQISKNNMSVLNMLNTKYFIVKNQAQGQQQQAAQEPMAMPNPEACGNAWFVKEIVLVENADKEMAALDSFNSKQTAIIDKRFEEELKGFTPKFDSTASIKLTSYLPNKLEYESNSNSDGYVVFSEIFYDKGWVATINGTEQKYQRCNYVLRGMKLPKGKNNVVFEFKPKTFEKGETMALVSSLLLFLFFVSAIYFEIKRNKS